MPMYAFIDPKIQDIMIGNVPPDDVSFWWEVPFGTQINDLFIDKNGDVAIYPERPGAWAEFDIFEEKWFDPRTDAEKAADLQYARRLAFATKSEILAGLMERKLITPEEAIAARYEIPQAAADKMTDLPADVKATAILQWSENSKPFNRLDPVIVAGAVLMNIPEETVDEIFKVRTE